MDKKVVCSLLLFCFLFVFVSSLDERMTYSVIDAKSSKFQASWTIAKNCGSECQPSDANNFIPYNSVELDKIKSYNVGISRNWYDVIGNSDWSSSLNMANYRNANYNGEPDAGKYSNVFVKYQFDINDIGSDFDKLFIIGNFKDDPSYTNYGPQVYFLKNNNWVVSDGYSNDYFKTINKMDLNDFKDTDGKINMLIRADLRYTKPSSSCAFVYSYDGEEYIPEFAIADSSAHKLWESESYGLLPSIKNINGKYTLAILEKVLETQYIDDFKLLRVIHPDNSWVIPSRLGSLNLFNEKILPISVYDSLGNSYLFEMNDNDSESFWITEGEKINELNEDNLTFKFDLSGYEEDNFNLAFNIKESGRLSNVWIDIVTAVEGYNKKGYSILNKNLGLFYEITDWILRRAPVSIYQKKSDGSYELIESFISGNTEFFHTFSVNFEKDSDSIEIVFSVPPGIYQIDNVYLSRDSNSKIKVIELNPKVISNNKNISNSEIQNKISKEDWNYFNLSYDENVVLEFYSGQELKEGESESILVKTNAYSETYSKNDDNSSFDGKNLGFVYNMLNSESGYDKEYLFNEYGSIIPYSKHIDSTNNISHNTFWDDYVGLIIPTKGFYNFIYKQVDGTGDISIYTTYTYKGDYSLCSSQFSCVYNGICYETGSVKDSDGDKKNDMYCDRGIWKDRDLSQSFCEVKKDIAVWNILGNADDKNACCGDDSNNENLITSRYLGGIFLSCCKNPTDCTYNGVCYNKEEKTPDGYFKCVDGSKWEFTAGNIMGTGTLSNPYIIYDCNQLNSIGKSSYLTLSSHYTLNNSINCNSVNFFPIGNSLMPFIGSLNGNGYSIENLNISADSTINSGLFGVMGAGAVVKNVHVVNANIVGYKNVGGIVGMLKSGASVINCSFNGIITAKYLYEDGSGTVIEREVVSESGSSGSSYFDTHLYFWESEESGCKRTGGSYVGGTCYDGCNYEVGDKCYSSCPYEYDNKCYEKEWEYKVDDTYYNDDDLSDEKVDEWVDTWVEPPNPALKPPRGHFIFPLLPFVSGQVVYGNGGENIGGIAGLSSGNIDSCYVESGSRILNTEDASGIQIYTNVGGIVGRMEGGKVSNSYFMGKVGKKTSMIQEIGGIAGEVLNGQILNSYVGRVDIESRSTMGGITGVVNPGDIKNSFMDSIYLESTEWPSGIVIGCISGKRFGSGIFESVYYKSDCAVLDGFTWIWCSNCKVINYAVEDGSDSGANTLGTIQVTGAVDTSINLFSTWDFSNVWKKTDSYPKLRWENVINKVNIDISALCQGRQCGWYNGVNCGYCNQDQECSDGNMCIKGSNSNIKIGFMEPTPENLVATENKNLNIKAFINTSSLESINFTFNGIKNFVNFSNLFFEMNFDGNLIDKIGGSYLTNHGTTFVDGKNGKAIELDGIEDYIEGDLYSSQLNNIAGSISISAWVYVDSYKNWAGIFTKGIEKSQYALQLDKDSGSKIQFTGDYTLGQYVISDGSLSIGTWNHVVVVYSANKNVKIYINGIKDKEQEINWAIIPNDEQFTIGVDKPGSDEYFDGKIDDLMIFYNLLDEQSVKFLYESKIKMISGENWIFEKTINNLNYSDKNGYPFSIYAKDSIPSEAQEQRIVYIVPDASPLVNITETYSDKNIKHFNITNIGNINIVYNDIEILSDNEDLKVVVSNEIISSSVKDELNPSVLRNGDSVEIELTFNYKEKESKKDYLFNKYDSLIVQEDKRTINMLYSNVYLDFRLNEETFARKNINLAYQISCPEEDSDINYILLDKKYSCVCRAFCEEGKICPCIEMSPSTAVHVLSDGSFVRIFFDARRTRSIF